MSNCLLSTNAIFSPWPPPPQSTTAAVAQPYSIFDSSSIIEVIGTRSTIDVFRPTPSRRRRDPRGTLPFLVLLLKTDHAARYPFRHRGHPRTIGIIVTRGTVDVFHPVPFGVADVLGAFDVRD